MIDQTVPNENPLEKISEESYKSSSHHQNNLLLPYKNPKSNLMTDQSLDPPEAPR